MTPPLLPAGPSRFSARLAGSRARTVCTAIVFLPLVSATAGAQDPVACCAQVIVSGSESGVVPPAARTYHVWVQPDARMFGWRRSFPDAAREAFEAWTRVDLPVEFRFVTDSAEANLFVFWRRWFNDRQRSRSTWWLAGAGDFVRGEIDIVAESSREWTPTNSVIHGLVLHEIGHLLGLRHEERASSIMARSIGVTRLSRRDVEHARSLYAGLTPAGETVEEP